MIVVGVDNGLDGGICILRDGCLPELHVMPTIDGKTKRHIYTPELTRIFRAMPIDVTHVYVERAGTRPGMGAASVFNYGMGCGIVLGIVAALQLPHTLVTPAKWSKHMHAGCAGDDTKARSAEAAMRLFPGVDFRATPRSKKPHDGLTEATLIASYGRHIITRGADSV